MSIGGSMNRYRLRDFNRNVRSFLYYGVLINAGMALFTLLYNLYLLRLSFQEDFIGQVASMAPLATAILALPTGILSDRIGRRPFLIASGVLLAGSQLGLVLAESPTALLALSLSGVWAAPSSGSTTSLSCPITPIPRVGQRLSLSGPRCRSSSACC